MSSKRTTVRLPAALLDEAKELAARKHTTVTELIETGLRMQLQAEEATPPLVLPVCALEESQGGLADGVPTDAWSWSAGKLEALMDELEGRLPHEGS